MTSKIQLFSLLYGFSLQHQECYAVQQIDLARNIITSAATSASANKFAITFIPVKNLR